MRVLKEYPPNYQDVLKAFPAVKQLRPVFTYGSTLFNPYGHHIQPDLMAHEETHEKQQNEIGVDEWWTKYLTSKIFRLRQEVEAYHNQYRAMSRPVRRRELDRIAKDLSGPLYGRLTDFNTAKEMIVNGRC